MEPLDPFGNRVDWEGRSLDRRGRPVDTERYLQVAGGELVRDPNRDHEYTRILGDRLADAYRRGNTIFPTHVAAFAAFRELERLNPGVDLYRLLRTGGAHDSLSFPDLVEVVGRLQARLLVLADADRIRLGERVSTQRADDRRLLALKAFGTYHTRPALERVGDRLYPRDRNLLYYSRNRLVGYGLERDDD